jgi:predicted nucleotidyltransferase
MTVVDDKRNASDGHAISAESLIEDVQKWAELRDDIRALAVVGSHARGEARSDSDIDLVVVCAEPARYLRDTNWLSTFDEVARFSFEDWGQVQSVRVLYRNGPEVEFGITGTVWMAIPPDEGTAAVLRNGSWILLDRDGQLGRLQRIVHGSA